MNDTTRENILIAEFMGGKHKKDMPIASRAYMDGNKYLWVPMHGIIRKEAIQYHSSWDWLMKVVEKIESLGHGVTIYRNGCHINDVKLFGVNGFNHKSKIEQTYKAVVEFIKWYKSKN